MKSKITMVIVLVGLALGGFGSAFGGNSYMTPFNTANGTAYNCGVCHTTATGSSSARVQFGADWARLRGNPINYSVATNNALAILDSDGDGITNLAEIQARTNPGVATTTGDTTLPTVSTFTIPSTSSSLIVSITALTATDNVGVTGYLVNESPTKPAAGLWPASAPASYTFSSPGAKTLYAWARDAAGNVSGSRSASVTITLPPTADSTLPTVSGFTVAATAGSLTVSITTFSATDNVGVTGYLVNENSTKPLATATGWTATVPTGYTFASAGAKTLYAWAKDSADNVSSGVSRTVTVTTSGGGGGEADVESPEVMEFTLPLTSTSLTVPIVAFRAIDNVAPTAYLITTTPTAPAANAADWKTTPPTSYTFPSGGAKTLYGWAKDGAGNVSESVWDNVDIAATTTSDRTLPVVTGFRIPSSSESLRVRITSFTATDNVRVTGYLVTATSTKPGASASGWRSTPPTSYSFTSAGTKRLYPWVKDAAGNVSASFSGSATVNISLEEDDDDEYRRGRD